MCLLFYNIFFLVQNTKSTLNYCIFLHFYICISFYKEVCQNVVVVTLYVMCPGDDDDDVCMCISCITNTCKIRFIMEMETIY